MKTAISLSDGLFRDAERVAKSLGISRSELYQKALTEFLARQDDQFVTDALNRIYTAENPGTLDPLFEQAQFEILPDEEW
ncbi:MAG TPA: CopG family transcriptional regulator [Candidatus Eisenbacteria bacterium]